MKIPLCLRLFIAVSFCLVSASGARGDCQYYVLPESLTLHRAVTKNFRVRYNFVHTSPGIYRNDGERLTGIDFKIDEPFELDFEPIEMTLRKRGQSDVIEFGFGLSEDRPVGWIIEPYLAFRDYQENSFIDHDTVRIRIADIKWKDFSEDDPDRKDFDKKARYKRFNKNATFWYWIYKVCSE